MIFVMASLVREGAVCAGAGEADALPCGRDAPEPPPPPPLVRAAAGEGAGAFGAADALTCATGGAMTVTTEAARRTTLATAFLSETNNVVSALSV